MLDKALKLAGTAFLTALTVLVLQGGIVLQHTSEALRDNADNLDKHLVNLELIAAATSGKTVGMVDKRLAETNAILDANTKLAILGLNARLIDTNHTLGQAVVMASDHLVNTEALLSIQLDKSNAALKTVADNTTKLSKDVTRVSLPLSLLVERTDGLVGQVSDAAPLYLDCDHNPSCAYNLFQGTAKSVEHIAQAGDRAVKKFEAPKSGKAKAWEGLKFGAVIVSKFGLP